MFHGIDSFIDKQGRYLQSAPVKVRMAGFESNTAAMMRAGWQMSIECRQHMYMDSMDIHCAFKHDGIKQVAIGIMRIDREHMTSAMSCGFMEMPWGIEINYMAPAIKYQIIPIRGGFAEWSAVDLNPQMSVMKDLTDFAVFKPIKVGENDFEIYIHQKDEKEILDILLSKQDARQKEIKQNMKRRDYIAGNEGKMITTLEDDLNRDIKHQIVLCG